MILLFTDFGENGPYLGQVIAKLRLCGFSGDIINLFADAPAFSVKASACLLAAYSSAFPTNSLFLSIVDPGVGGKRKAMVVKSGGRWFVGPDNGLFEMIVRQDKNAEAWEIGWRPDTLSSSFHGRDLFAPIAAYLLADDTEEKLTPISLLQLVRFDWPDDIAEIVYIDHYGNAMTGLRSGQGIKSVAIGKRNLNLSRTFSSVPGGEPLVYENANGLIEIAVNQGRADDYFDLSVGSPLAYSKV
ncbi:MAG: SAM-dependent chlorinase/fluorinase [Sneathiella sp.]|nr:SAM-dependent chlorinase/fluorinase [Sneathiella sp.]